MTVPGSAQYYSQLLAEKAVGIQTYGLIRDTQRDHAPGSPMREQLRQDADKVLNRQAEVRDELSTAGITDSQGNLTEKGRQMGVKLPRVSRW